MKLTTILPRPLPGTLFLLLLALLFASSAGADEAKGVEQFKTLKCNMCHAIEKLGVEATIKKAEMLGPDLSKVGAQHDAEWIRKWLLREVELEGKTHKSQWKGTPKDLETIGAWLATLKE